MDNSITNMIRVATVDNEGDGINILGLLASESILAQIDTTADNTCIDISANKQVQRKGIYVDRDVAEKALDIIKSHYNNVEEVCDVSSQKVSDNARQTSLLSNPKVMFLGIIFVNVLMLVILAAAIIIKVNK